MHELLPVAAGALIGLAVQRVRAPRLRVILFVGLCLLFGTLASLISGELELSFGFIPIDALLVWAGALAGTVVVALWRRRTEIL